MIIRKLTDEPTKPGTPEIIDYDNESVTLKWTPPSSDGGAPLEKYIIEKKDRLVTRVFIITLSYNLKKLV